MKPIYGNPLHSDSHVYGVFLKNLPVIVTSLMLPKMTKMISNDTFIYLT